MQQACQFLNEQNETVDTGTVAKSSAMRYTRAAAYGLDLGQALPVGEDRRLVGVFSGQTVGQIDDDFGIDLEDALLGNDGESGVAVTIGVLSAGQFR